MTTKVRALFDGALNTNLQGLAADVGGTWQVAAATGTLNGKLAGDGSFYNNDSLDRMVNTTPTAANDRAKMKFKFYTTSTTRQLGPACRIQSTTSPAGYWLVFSPTGWDFFKLDAGGAYTSIASGTATIAAGVWHTGEIVPTGSSFALYLNGALLATPTDSTYGAGGYSGMHTRNGNGDWFDASTAGDPDPDAPSDTTPPTLSSAVGTSTGSTTATVGATTDEANGTMYAIVSTSSTPPSAAQIQAGQTNTGAAAPWSGNQAISSTGAKTFNATGLSASTTYYGHIQHRDAAGNNSSVLTSSSFTTSAGGDTTPPTLSSPTGTATGATTASGTVSTDEANGTLYYYASTNATETAATVKASGASQAVSATGSQSVSFTGLTAGTVYYAHYVHRDAAGNDSTRVSSSSFTTSAAGSFTSGALKRNNGTLAASKTLTWITLLNDTTGAFVATKTGVTTNSSGVFTTSDAGMVAGTVYRAVWRESTGERGHGWVAAA